MSSGEVFVDTDVIQSERMASPVQKVRPYRLNQSSARVLEAPECEEETPAPLIVVKQLSTDSDFYLPITKKKGIWTTSTSNA